MCGKALPYRRVIFINQRREAEPRGKSNGGRCRKGKPFRTSGGRAAIEQTMSASFANDSQLTGYAAVRDGGAGLIDLSNRGRILVDGSEAVMFLNGLITNDIKTLAVNSWMPAAFANVQGRLLAVVRVIHREDGFLIDTDSAARETVLKLLERFTLAGDFRVADLTGAITSISVQGNKAAEILGAVLKQPVSGLARGSVLDVQTGGKRITLIRATHTGEDGFDLFVDVKDSDFLRDELSKAGARVIDQQVAETLRIEAGVPVYGMDIDETTIVTEANLDDAVSFTKGCYVGQEIVIRIKHRGHVAKRLAGIVLEENDAVESGAKIFSEDEKEIGRVTSSTFSPALNRAIALGYVKYDYLTPETSVKILADGGQSAGRVAELPFVRGSWYAD
jgi:folate-binding protein YgfZ